MERNTTFSGLFDDDNVANESDTTKKTTTGSNQEKRVDAVELSEIDELFPAGETDDPDKTDNNVDEPAKGDDTHYLVSMSERGVHIEDPKIFKKMDKLSLSPSTVAAMEQCPAKWVFEKYAKKEIVPDEDDTPARRGNVFHDIMEEFFMLKPEDRTPAALTEITKSMITKKYPEFKSNSEVINWTKDAIQGYYKMGGKPKKVRVAEVPKHKNHSDSPDVMIPGLEIFVKGKLGNATRETLGFIDQVIEDPKEEGAVIVSDWKSGAKFKEFKKTTKSNDGFNEVRQQIIYSMLMEQQGVNVSSARLIYPVARKVVNVDIYDEEIRLRIIDSIEKADAKLDEYIEANTFEYGPSFLCSWCPLVNICGAADKKPFKKAVDARKKQPTPEELLKGVKIQ